MCRESCGKHRGEEPPEGLSQASKEPGLQTEISKTLAGSSDFGSDGQAREQITGMEQLMLDRDAVTFSLLWATSARGANAGSFRLNKFGCQQVSLCQN